MNLSMSIIYGMLASVFLLAISVAAMSLISGVDFAVGQLRTYGYYFGMLAVGFGVQVGLYVYLKQSIRGTGAGKIVGITGTTSTAAMISCCAHYLVNILPLLGVAGAVTFIVQYQVELFWVGILFNLGGIIYIANKIYQFSARGGSAFGGKHS